MFKKCYLLLCYCCLQTRIAFERTGQRSDRYEVTWFCHGGWQRHVRHVECHGAQRGMWRVQGDRGTADNTAQHVIAIIRNWKPNSVSKAVCTQSTTTYHCSSSDWNRKRGPGPHQHTGVKWTHILMVRPQRFYSDWESWKYDTQTRQERRQGVQEGEYRSYGMYGPWQPPTRLRLRDQWPDRDKTFYGSLTQQNRKIFWWLSRANKNVNKLTLCHILSPWLSWMRKCEQGSSPGPGRAPPSSWRRSWEPRAPAPRWACRRWCLRSWAQVQKPGCNLAWRAMICSGRVLESINNGQSWIA